jgi:soluble cytochrome b562
MVRAEALDDETKRLLLHGMQNLVSALGEVMGLADNGELDSVH